VVCWPLGKRFRVSPQAAKEVPQMSILLYLFTLYAWYGYYDSWHGYYNETTHFVTSVLLFLFTAMSLINFLLHFEDWKTWAKKKWWYWTGQ
jgi:hypothetical protein